MIDPTLQRPQRTKFQDALLRERARMQLSRRTIADQCGVDKKTIERWEDGESIPSVQQFKRLIGLLRRVAPFAPEWGWAGTAAVDGRFQAQTDEMRELTKQLERDSPIPRPAPQSFADGLRRVREENDITQGQLGELLGVTAQAVGAWEADDACPVRENMDKLFQVLPEIEASIRVGAIMQPEPRDIPKPVGSTGHKFPRASTIDSALEMALESSDAQRDLPRPERPRWEMPTERVSIPPLVEPAPHAHRFDLDETQPGTTGPSPVRTGRKLCSVCGKPEESRPSMATEVRRPQVGHQHVVRRCPCNGLVKPTGDAERPFVCKRCSRLLAEAELHESALEADDVSVLAADFGELTVRVARARRAREVAERTAAEAKQRADEAEAELKTTRELLELAAQEASK